MYQFIISLLLLRVVYLPVHNFIDIIMKNVYFCHTTAMFMKKLISLIALGSLALSANAGFNRLVFRTLDGAEQSIGLTDLNISFIAGEIVASSEGESVKIELTSLQSMEFSNGPASIETVTGDKPLQGSVTAYTSDGKSYMTYDTAAEAFEQLPAGVYIITAENGMTLKVLINR